MCDINYRDEIEYFLENKNYISPWILSPDTENPLSSIADKIVSVKRNEILLSQGMPSPYVYVVKSGRMRCYSIGTDGSEQCLYLAESGILVGEICAISHKNSFYNLIATRDSELYRIPIGRVMEYISSDLQAMHDFFNAISHKTRIITSQLEYTAKGSLIRVCATILAMAIHYGQQDLDEIKVTVMLTHEEFAVLNNLNRVTVTKAISSMVNKGIISHIPDTFIIHDLEKMKAILE